MEHGCGDIFPPEVATCKHCGATCYEVDGTYWWYPKKCYPDTCHEAETLSEEEQIRVEYAAFDYVLKAVFGENHERLR